MHKFPCQQHGVKDLSDFTNQAYHLYTRKSPRLADKTIVFSEHEISKVVVMVTR